MCPRVALGSKFPRARHLNLVRTFLRLTIVADVGHLGEPKGRLGKAQSGHHKIGNLQPLWVGGDGVWVSHCSAAFVDLNFVDAERYFEEIIKTVSAKAAKKA